MRRLNSRLVIVILLGVLVVGSAFGSPSKIEKTQPQLDWQIGYRGAVDPDIYFPNKIITSRKGDLYLLASYRVAMDNPPFFSFYSIPSLIKLDSDGNELWEIKFGDESERTTVNFVDTDDKCNIYVGQLDSIINEMKITKYDKDGNYIWEQAFIGNDSSYRVKIEQVDKKGNIYLTQGNAIDNGVERYTITKLGSNGDIQWKTDHVFLPDDITLPSNNRRPPPNRTVFKLKVDRWGNVVTVCSAKWQINLAKYDKNGNVVWADSFGGQDCYVSIYDIAISSSGNICLSLTDSTIAIVNLPPIGPPGLPINVNTDTIIMQYDPDGNIDFVLDQDMPKRASLMIDKSGNIYLAGITVFHESDPISVYKHYYSVDKLDKDGYLQWSHISTVSSPSVYDLIPGGTPYHVVLDEHSGDLYAVFRADEENKILQKINSRGHICYEYQFRGYEYPSQLPYYSSRYSLIKGTKKDMYFLEKQSESLYGFSTDSGYALMKFTEENVISKQD